MHMEAPTPEEIAARHAWAAHLRAEFDAQPDLYLKAADRGHYPQHEREWQLPWELRMFKIIEDALDQTDLDEIDGERGADAVQIAMIGVLEALDDDLTRGLPWWKRFFIRRSTLRAELSHRVRHLARH